MFLSLTITISYFILGNETNGLLVTMIGMSPFMLLFFKRKITEVDMWLFFLLLLMFAFAFTRVGFRPISYFYSVCFVSAYICLRDSFLQNKFPMPRMLRILRNILYAYAIVLLIQQICVIIGITPINQTFGFEENKWKLPSLAQEPSHMAIFVFFFMYSYILISEKILGHKYTLDEARKEKWVWISYFWCMLTCQSTSAIMYCGLLFLRYFKPKTLFKYGIALIFVIFPIYFFLKDTPAFQRVILFSEAFLTLDINKINGADHSAAYRFFPMFYLFNNLDIISPNFWIGHGLDFGKETLNEYALYVSNDVAYDGNINIGGFFGYILDYGMLCFLILCLAIRKAISGVGDLGLLVFYIWLNLFVGFNMQLFWSSTTLLTYISIYNKKKIIYWCNNKNNKS